MGREFSVSEPIAQIEETARWGQDWQRAGEWAAHTVGQQEAVKLAASYLRMVRVATGRKDYSGIRGLGIGSGAGYLETAMAKYGFRVVASEWNEEGLRLIEIQNPHLERRRLDLLDFADKNSWDLILCRELYPFTRTNAFSWQMGILSRLIDALRPGGCLLLIGSDTAYPHCMDYRLMLRCLKADPRIAKILGPVLESLAKRIHGFPMNAASYRFLNAIGEFAFSAIKAFSGRKLAGIRIYLIVKVS
jgi:SAM-dependent methyltransferase